MDQFENNCLKAVEAQCAHVRLRPKIELYVMANNNKMSQAVLPPPVHMYHVRNIFGASPAS